jgi:hypothetical protein
MKTKITLLFIILALYQLTAQDRQFWDQAVGGRTALLGGIAVGGVRDYSAAFYNPGALIFLTQNKLNFSFNMYGIKDFKFNDGGGPGINSRYTRVSLYPSSLAGSLPFLGDSLNRFAYMIYANGYSFLRISERFEGYEDVIPARPPSQPGLGNEYEGNEFLINQGKLDALLQEVTVCFGWSRKISDNVGFGFTILGAYRDQTKVRYESYSAFDTTYQRTATTDLFVDIDYWAVRFYGKFGISAEWEKLKLGATLTTPSVAMKIASGGTDGASISSSNVYFKVDSLTNQVTSADILASDRQEGLPVNYKSPFSISAGFEYTISEKTKIHFAAEWFAPLSTYVVMQPESDNFVRNSPDIIGPLNSAQFLQVSDAMKSILNVGLALEQKLNDKFTGYAAFRTDFSNANYKTVDGLFIGYTDFNIYHFTIGTSLELNNTFIGLGFEYSHAERSDFPQIFNFPSLEIQPEDIVIYGFRNDTKAVYNNFNLFFGITQLL